ncbi:MAG: hypothetical protein WA840_00995 [Caulobacteraceae bacterium]
MGTALQHNIGAYIAIATSVFPQAVAANVNGAGIDRFAHNMALSCVLHQLVGAEAGAPTGVSVQTKLQHSPDDVTWADYDAPGGATVAQTVALTAAATENSVAIDLSSANRYVRAVTLVTLTGGETPTVEVAADIVFGGESLLSAA